jgi:hypothetical protein
VPKKQKTQLTPFRCVTLNKQWIFPHFFRGLHSGRVEKLATAQKRF